jgi:hypothetical protein
MGIGATARRRVTRLYRALALRRTGLGLSQIAALPVVWAASWHVSLRRFAVCHLMHTIMESESNGHRAGQQRCFG